MSVCSLYTPRRSKDADEERVGFDLEGNTFWEFKNRLHPSKPRRIVHLVGGNRHSGGHIVDHAYNLPRKFMPLVDHRDELWERGD